MKSTLEVLSIFFISILFLFSTTNKEGIEIKENKANISSEMQLNLSKNIDYKATPIIIVKRD